MSSMQGSQESMGSNRVLVEGGGPQAVMLVASDAHAAAERFNELLYQYAGARLERVNAAEAAISTRTVLVFCTLESRGQVKGLLSPELLAMQLKPEGFALTAESPREPLVLMGHSPAGLRYAIGELWNYQVRLTDSTAEAPAAINLVEAPAFSKRILWNWDTSTNWDDDLRKVHQTRVHDPGATQYPYETSPDAFNTHFERVVDFEADHKLNGLIIWGFIRDEHGGIEAAQRLSRYARERHVRVLPGIGTVWYGGFYNAGKSLYNMEYWLAQHPEVKRMNQGGAAIEAPCPSDAHLPPWLEEGTRWFLETFPDIGGANLEHGDFFECECETCKAERARPENDDNFYWDMMRTIVPVMKAAHEINPDLWLTYGTYTGYKRKMMANPPRFLEQFPDYAIVQWTYTDMVDDIERDWPPDLKPPAEARHSIGLLHHGGLYYYVGGQGIWSMESPWWSSPGQCYGLVPEVIQKTCARAIEDGSEGIEIEGEVGIASPQNELNYLAFEEFTWHPQQTVEGWISIRLAALYGGEQLARRFYALVSDPTTSPEAIEAAQAEAAATAGMLKDPRQVRRWRNLSLELTRRLAIARTGQVAPYKGNWDEYEPRLVIPW